MSSESKAELEKPRETEQTVETDHSGLTPRNSKENGSEGAASDIAVEEGGRQKFTASRQTKIILAILMLLALICAVDATSISTALPVISAELHGTTIQSVWVGSSFLLTSAVFQPLIASLSEIFGRRPATMGSLVMFTIGAIMGGVAKNFTVLIVARSIQGVGGGGLLALTEMIVADLIPLRERGFYYSLLGAIWSFGTVIGPILGGGFTSNATWRWVFYINLPFCGIALVLIPFFLKLHLPESSLKEKFKKIDYIGICIFISSCTSLLLGIIFGGVTFPWNSYHVIVPIVLGAVGIIVFVVYEKLYAPEPMIRLSIFKSPIASAGFAMVTIHGLVLWCLMYYLPVYFQAVKGYSALSSGLALLPITILCAPSAIVAGVSITISGKYNWGTWVGWALASLGAGILVLMTPDTTLGQNIGLVIPVSIGAGILFSTLNYTVLTPNTNEDTPYAAAMLSFLRVIGQTFGVAIGGAIFANKFKSNLAANPEVAEQASAFSSEALSIVEYIRLLPNGTERDILRLAVSNALHIVYYATMAFCIVGLILNVFVRDLPLDVVYQARQHATDVVHVSESEKEMV